MSSSIPVRRIPRNRKRSSTFPAAITLIPDVRWQRMMNHLDELISYIHSIVGQARLSLDKFPLLAPDGAAFATVHHFSTSPSDRTVAWLKMIKHRFDYMARCIRWLAKKMHLPLDTFPVLPPDRASNAVHHHPPTAATNSDPANAWFDMVERRSPHVLSCVRWLAVQTQRSTKPAGGVSGAAAVHHPPPTAHLDPLAVPPEGH